MEETQQQLERMIAPLPEEQKPVETVKPKERDLRKVASGCYRRKRYHFATRIILSKLFKTLVPKCTSTHNPRGLEPQLSNCYNDQKGCEIDFIVLGWLQQAWWLTRLQTTAK